MNCEKIQQTVWTGSGDLSDDALLHIQTCLHCQRELDAIAYVKTDLRGASIPKPTRSLLPPKDVIRETIQSHTHHRRGNRFRFLMPVLASSVALVAAIAMTYSAHQVESGQRFGIRHGGHPPQSSPRKETTTHGVIETIRLGPGLQLDTYRTKTFTAKILVIRNAKRVRLVVNRPSSVRPNLSTLIASTHATAGMTVIPNLEPNGSQVEPIAWSALDSTSTLQPGQRLPMFGINRSGNLVYGNFTTHDLRQKHLNTAAWFGPVLVENGTGLVKGDGGWGYAPRSAIGQTKTGEMILIATDGRFYAGRNDTGATLKDIQDLMLKYGASTALNLFGLSRTEMMVHQKVVSSTVIVPAEQQTKAALLIDAKSP